MPFFYEKNKEFYAYENAFILFSKIIIEYLKNKNIITS